MWAGMASLTVTRTTEPKRRWRTLCSMVSSRSSASSSWIIHFGIAGDAEGMRFEDLHAREELVQVGGDDLLQPDEIMVVGHGAILAYAAR